MESEKDNRVLVFDWGNTLMRVFPQFGPMVTWDKVEALPGAEKSLQILAKNHSIILATNASDSDASQVRDALKRVGMVGSISKIFTFHEIGARKPDPAFFRRIKDLTNASSPNMIMIGDDPDADIMGAHQAGWRTVWLNEAIIPCPGLKVIHDFEITSMSALPGTIEKDYLPSYEVCLTWLKENGANDHLLSHVALVAGIAYLLAVRGNKMAVPIDPVLAHRGGLLHDLCKTSGDPAIEDHGKSAAKFLYARSQHLLAEIVDRHLLSRILSDSTKPLTWEQKVVFYADKLAEGNTLVPVDLRLEHLKNRYPNHRTEIESASKAIKIMEDEFCRMTQYSRKDLLRYLKKNLSKSGLLT